MFQIIFNELSAAEISALPKKLQLDLLAEFQILPEDLDHLESKRFGLIEREGKKLYRYRRKITESILRDATRGSPSIASCTRTRSAIFFSVPNSQSRKTRNWAKRASFGS